MSGTRRLICCLDCIASLQLRGNALHLCRQAPLLKSNQKSSPLGNGTIRFMLRFQRLSTLAPRKQATRLHRLSLRRLTRRYKTTPIVQRMCLTQRSCRRNRLLVRSPAPHRRHLLVSCRINTSVSSTTLYHSATTNITPDLFFQEWQPLLPILHRPTFLRVYEQYLAGPDAGNWQANKQAIAQLFLIFEISSLSSGHQAKSNASTYEHQWRRALYSTSSTPNTSTIQCQVLAQLCYLLRGDYTHLARHRAISVGMCHELGLHQGHRYHNLQTFEVETRRRIFWCQYVLDKYVLLAPFHMIRN